MNEFNELLSEYKETHAKMLTWVSSYDALIIRKHSSALILEPQLIR